MREKKDKDCMIQNTWRAYLFVSSFQTKSGSNITEQYKTNDRFSGIILLHVHRKICFAYSEREQKGTRIPWQLQKYIIREESANQLKDNNEIVLGNIR
jgi:hypothetical protein